MPTRLIRGSFNGSESMAGGLAVTRAKYPSDEHPKRVRKPLRWRDALKIVSMNGDRFVCAYCDDELDLTTAEVDHVIPISKGGSNDRYNLEIVCRECNRVKGSKALDDDLLEFLKYGAWE